MKLFMIVLLEGAGRVALPPSDLKFGRSLSELRTRKLTVRLLPGVPLLHAVLETLGGIG